MAGEAPATSGGMPALAGHQELNSDLLKRVFADDHGSLRVCGGANLINFTYSDGKIATMDVYKYVNGVNLLKRFTFTWSGDDIESIAIAFLPGD